MPEAGLMDSETRSIESQDITFRLSNPKDACQLADLRWRLQTDDSDTHGQEYNAFVEAFTNQFVNSQDNGIIHWLAEINNQIVSVMSIREVQQVPAPDRLDGCWGYLTNCYTLPLHRGCGIGTELLAKVRQWAEQRNYELLIVWPSDKSYPFYERSGFHRYEDPLVLKLREADLKAICKQSR